MSQISIPPSVSAAYQAASSAYDNALASVGGDASKLDPAWQQGMQTAQAGYDAWLAPSPQATQNFSNDYSAPVVHGPTAPLPYQGTPPGPLPTGSGVTQPSVATSVSAPSVASIASLPTTPSQPALGTDPSLPPGHIPGISVPGNQALTNVNSNSVTNPTLPTGTNITATPITSDASDIQQNEQLTGPNPAATFNSVGAASTSPMQASSPAAQVTPAANSQTAVQANQMVAAQMANDPRTQTTAAQVTPQAQDLATAAQGTVDPNNSTMQGQMAQLMNFAPGQIPDWAQGAVTTANQQMAARGITASTIAGNATASAVLQAALPIAQNDAQTYATMGLQNLSNQQAAVMQNASTIASMDMQNASFAQQAGIVNAQSFLQQDLSNLNNQQQAAVLNTQSIVQSIFTDQAAQNAAQQFNATSQNQVDQFYKSLSANTSQFNAAQLNNMNQFNATGNSAVSQFNAQLDDLRQRFNVQNATAIDQSNVTWQRSVNTANTAAVNAANQTNATNLLGISNTAMANLWQQSLDEASFSFQGSQNANTLQANIAMAALLNNQNVSNALMQGVGNFAANLLGAALGGT